VLSRKVLALLPQLPIIICTGFSDNLDEEKARAMGVRAYLQKPVTESTLAACVRKLLDEPVSGGPV